MSRRILTYRHASAASNVIYNGDRLKVHNVMLGFSVIQDKLYAVSSSGTAQIAGWQPHKMNEIDLTTDWQVASVTYNDAAPFYNFGRQGMFVTSDGAKAFISNSNTMKYYQFSTNKDITSLGSLVDSFDFGYNIQSFKFKSDGTRLVTTDASAIVRTYSLSTPWYPSTNTLISDSSGDFQLRSALINDDGTVLIGVDITTKDLKQYSLSTSWDLATKTLVKTIDMSALATDPATLSNGSISDDGTHLYLGGTTSVGKYNIYGFELTVGWELGNLIDNS